MLEKIKKLSEEIVKAAQELPDTPVQRTEQSARKLDADKVLDFLKFYARQ